MISELNPGIILIAGALLIPVLPNSWRNRYMIAIPVAAFAYVLGLPIGEFGKIQLFDMTLTTLRVDNLSLTFGYIFLIATLIGVIYALHIDDHIQHTAGMIYAGSAVGAAFAGDFVTLFVFWELTAIASVFLIWAARTQRAYDAGQRYLIVQIGSGVILLAGILIYYRETGSIAFNAIGIETLACQIILVAIGIKCAFPLLHNWLQDAYPEATITGTVILSAFTTKLAVYALARGYAGTDILIPIGAIMAAFPLFYGIIENDLRRVLAYALNNQLGFMVVGVGIGTELAINGVAAHAFVHILYKSLLFMAVGAVLFRVGTAKASELGGLVRDMPLTLIFYFVGAAAIALPFFSGFVAKSLIVSAALKGEHFWAWMTLVLASAGVFLICGLRLPYVIFLQPASAPYKDKKEVPVNMLIAMGAAAALCIGIGVYYHPLYAILPYDVKYAPYTLDHIVTQLQIVAFTMLVFNFMLRRNFFPTAENSILLEVDWFSRKLSYNIAVTLTLMAQASWRIMINSIVQVAVDLEKWINMHHSTGSIFGRTWPTGNMAFWATVMLGGYLILLYFR